MAKLAEINKACDKVLANGVVGMRLWDFAFIEVHTIDADSLKVMSITLDKRFKTIQFKTFDRLQETFTESSLETINYRQADILKKRLESEYWPETEHSI